MLIAEVDQGLRARFLCGSQCRPPGEKAAKDGDVFFF
jgi:hypothetical protein